MRYHFLLILIMLLVLVPVQARIDITGGYIEESQIISQDNAQTFSYACDPGKSIDTMEFEVPINTVVNFTIYYGTGSVISGWMIYRPAGSVGISYSEVSIGGNTYSETFIDAQAAGYSLTKHIQFAGYAVNKSVNPATPGFAIFDMGYGLYSNEIAFYPVPDITNNLIYGVDYSATQEINFDINVVETEALQEVVTLTGQEYTVGLLTDQASKLMAYFNMLWSFFITAIGWFKFFFIDNLLMTVCIYGAVTAAWAANKSRDIFDFYRKFFRTQKAIFEFAVNMINTVISMITAVINALKPV